MISRVASEIAFSAHVLRTLALRCARERVDNSAKEAEFAS